MPPVRRNKQSTTSPGEISSHYCHNDMSVPTIQLNSLSLVPTTPETNDSHDASLPPLPAKKKRSHGKARPPGHIPRPPNAFIIFRTEYIKSQASLNSTPEVSKNLGEIWRNLLPSEKRPWIEKAKEAKLLHQEEHPDYKYKPVHRRDEFGNCIRKPRSPNRPRVKKAAGGANVPDHLPESFQWLEAKPAVEYPNTALSSDASSVSSPPPSPSPVPSLHGPSPSTSYLLTRRSSSVPPAGPNDSFFFGPAPSSAYPSASTGFYTGHAGRLSKRPSTSMDFMCAGLGHSEVYGVPNGTETYLSPNDSWRLGHRRSISAPDFGGEIPNFIFPSHNAPQEPNPLTPINPVFGNVFDRFSWNIPQTVDSSSQNTHADFASMPSFSTMGHKQQEYITVEIPATTSNSSSNFPSATSPPVSTPSSQLSSLPVPAILHPAPVATFDFSAFEEQMSQFEFDAAASQGGYEDPLGVVAQTCLPVPDAGAVYDLDAQFFVTPGDGHTAVTALQATVPPATQSSSDSAPLHPRPADGLSADLQDYQEGLRYTRRRPEITPPCALDFNELIVDTY